MDTSLMRTELYGWRGVPILGRLLYLYRYGSACKCTCYICIGFPKLAVIFSSAGLGPKIHNVECRPLPWHTTATRLGGGGGGGVNQAYSRLSTTHGYITDCKLDSVVHASVCEVILCGPVLFGLNDLCPTIFGCQATDWNPPQVSRKESLRPFILTPSRPVGCLTH